MRIAEKIKTRRPFFSFEFFPPRDDAAERSLFETIEALKPLDPGFVSITYGAGGSTRTRTVELAKRLRGEVGFDVMAHVTCAITSKPSSLRSRLATSTVRARVEPPAPYMIETKPGSSGLSARIVSSRFRSAASSRGGKNSNE